VAAGPPPPPANPTPLAPEACANAVDYIDPRYGGRIRQLLKPDGHEHNIYYHRNPFNADGSAMIGVQSDLDQANWRIVLYDGDGCFLRDLYPLGEYDWRVTWDRHDPDALFARKGTDLYRYNVQTGTGELLASFAAQGGWMPNSPSLNQAGDRILVLTRDGPTFRSFRLPDMSEPRSFKVTFPPGCVSDWEDERYIGYGNYVATSCVTQDLSVKRTYIYDDTGALLHEFDGSFGHTDFSPAGRWAYFKMPSGGRRADGTKSPLEIRVVNIDGTDDRLLYSVPFSQAAYVRNLHISWPDCAADAFFVSFFPSSDNIPASYAPPLDEIMLVRPSTGQATFVARTGTAIPAGFSMFWAQPLASPSRDGRRISFNSNAAGTIDQHLLFLERALTGAAEACDSGAAVRQDH